MSPARWLRGFARFWIDFLVGDDWLVAAGVGVALLATWGLVAAGVSAWWLLPPAVVLAIAVSLRRAVRRER
jgi:hypothetical protein